MKAGEYGKVEWQVVYDPTRDGEWYGDYYRRLFSRWQIVAGCGSWPEGLKWQNRRTGEWCEATGHGHQQMIAFSNGEHRKFKVRVPPAAVPAVAAADVF